MWNSSKPEHVVDFQGVAGSPCWTWRLRSFFQKDVFQDLGRAMLDSAWRGYNATLLAYGQTGSGKSYSMMGFGANKGLVPRVCEELFRATETQERNQEHQVRTILRTLFKGFPPAPPLFWKSPISNGSYWHLYFRITSIFRTKILITWLRNRVASK